MASFVSTITFVVLLLFIALMIFFTIRNAYVQELVWAGWVPLLIALVMSRSGGFPDDQTGLNIPSQRHWSCSSGLRESIPWIRLDCASRVWRSWKHRSHLCVPHLVCSARSERREVLSDGSHSVLYLYAHLGRFSCFYLDYWTGQDWNSVHAELCATVCDDREHLDQMSMPIADVG